MGVKQQQWTPTIRRGPIAAEIKSPAPNFVDLPPLLGKKIAFIIHNNYKKSSLLATVTVTSVKCMQCMPCNFNDIVQVYGQNY